MHAVPMSTGGLASGWSLVFSENVMMSVSVIFRLRMCRRECVVLAIDFRTALHFLVYSSIETDILVDWMITIKFLAYPI